MPKQTEKIFDNKYPKKKLLSNKKIIFGIDEVGRGSLAGPVVACAFCSLDVNPTDIYRQAFYPSSYPLLKHSFFLRDSKKMNAKKRLFGYRRLKRMLSVKWAIAMVNEKVIDKINIVNATKLAMQKAVLALEKKIHSKADLLLIDGNIKIDISCPQKNIIDGDEKVPLIAVASILAKVKRDNYMLKMHYFYPQYNFALHKGYGTKKHLTALAHFGPCKIHRFTFAPIKNNMKK